MHDFSHFFHPPTHSITHSITHTHTHTHTLAFDIFVVVVAKVIGQRLLTGRLAIAEAALVAIRQLFYKSKEYADNKLVNGIGGKRSLSSLPHLKHIFDEVRGLV